MRTADAVLEGRWASPPGARFGPLHKVLEMGVGMSTVVVADNVARYVHERNAPLCFEEFPSLAPPWPMFWVEYPSSSGRERRGVFAIDMTEEVRQVERGEEDPAANPVTDWAWGAFLDATETNGRGSDEVRWALVLLLLVQTRGGTVWGPVGAMAFALDAAGKSIGNRWALDPMQESVEDAAKVAAAVLREQGVTPEDAARMKDLAETDPEARRLILEQLHAGRDDGYEQLARIDSVIAAGDAIVDAAGVGEFDPEWLMRACAPACQTIAFLHCRNVVTEAFDPPAKVQAKRRRRGRKPLVRYHTLRLEVPRRQTDPDGPRRGQGADTAALHIVAGHFAHYGECCPDHPPKGRLFGRLEGVYWVPSHLRGDPERGVVRTDFDVEPIPGDAADA